MIVVGGGDTASDCIGVAHRQGAASVTSFQIWPSPPREVRRPDVWPFVPDALTVSSSHEEGGDRVWAVATQRFLGDGHVQEVETLDVEVVSDHAGRRQRREAPGTERRWQADLVLIAVGYTGPETDALTAQTAVTLDEGGRVRTGQDYATDDAGVFAAGDARRGASLVVWAISEGREAARQVDLYLQGTSALPTKGEGDLPRA